VKLILALAIAAATLGAPAPAQTPVVDAARRAGLVGERFDGYLGSVTAPSAILRGQLDAINIRRRALYSNLAASRGVTPQDVGITAGCQLLARVAPGQFYMLNDGRWRRRGTESVVPSYCR
jgi:uncharacterized protein YdbL (DUF1318 family)